MKLVTLTIGSWFPKTIIHLKEFENFLRGKKLDPQLPMETATKLYLALDPSLIEAHTNTEGVKFVHGQSSGCDFTYFGDGLLTVSRSVTNFEHDKDSIQWFYRKILAPALTFIYSRGALGLELIRKPELHKPMFLHVQSVNSSEVRDIFVSTGEDIHAMYSYEECDIVYGDNLIVISTKDERPKFDIKRLIEYLVLFNEVKRHSAGLLETHRFVWDEAEKIISESRILVKDLPMYDELLTDYSNKVDNILSRIDQMRLNFGYRVARIRENHLLFPKLSPNFENLEQDLDYLKNLFEMTRLHLKNNIDHIASIYQQNQENALNKLQLLFLLSAVSGFIGLGCYAVYQPDNPDANYYNFFNFDIINMIEFGAAALLLTLLVYYIWNYRFQNLRTRLKKG